MTTNGIDPETGLTIPSTLYGYEVIGLVGHGAGSVIYSVRSPSNRLVFALKHVVRKDEKSIRFIDQLEVEYEVSRHFTHPGLRRSIDMRINRTLLRKVTDGYLVMELVEGQPLEVSLPSSLVAILDCFVQTSLALEALHEMGFVHCDLKPNNILLSQTGQSKLIDFGQTCRIGTKKERIQGTPDFISPEQVRCQPVSPRTDVFNFGATLYWALTLRKLPTLFTLKKTENSFLFDDVMTTPMVINPQIPEPLSNFVMECVRTNPTKRPQNMAEVRRRLEAMRQGISQKQGPASASVA